MLHMYVCMYDTRQMTSMRCVCMHAVYGLHVCVHARMYAFTSACMYVCLCTWALIYKCICTSLCTDHVLLSDGDLIVS
jgi:hypothetical protein